MGLIDLGLIDGNFFNAAHVDLIEAAINVGQPAGEVRLSVAAVAPAGWLFLSGQVVVNFQGLYPQTWAVIPAGWKSGSNANLPNMEQKFPIGAHASFPLGTSGGSLTKTINTINLPVHSHTIDHDHPLFVASGATGDAVDNIHGLGTGKHNHGPGPGGGATAFVTDGGAFVGAAIALGGAAYVKNNVGTTFDGDLHQHNFNVNIDVPNFTGSSGNTGSGTALDITPSWVAFNFMLRVY